MVYAFSGLSLVTLFNFTNVLFINAAFLYKSPKKITTKLIAQKNSEKTEINLTSVFTFLNLFSFYLTTCLHLCSQLLTKMFIKLLASAYTQLAVCNTNKRELTTVCIAGKWSNPVCILCRLLSVFRSIDY